MFNDCLFLQSVLRFEVVDEQFKIVTVVLAILSVANFALLALICDTLSLFITFLFTFTLMTILAIALAPWTHVVKCLLKIWFEAFVRLRRRDKHFFLTLVELKVLLLVQVLNLNLRYNFVEILSVFGILETVIKHKLLLPVLPRTLALKTSILHILIFISQSLLTWLWLLVFKNKTASPIPGHGRLKKFSFLVVNCVDFKSIGVYFVRLQNRCPSAFCRWYLHLHLLELHHWVVGHLWLAVIRLLKRDSYWLAVITYERHKPAIWVDLSYIVMEWLLGLRGWQHLTHPSQLINFLLLHSHLRFNLFYLYFKSLFVALRMVNILLVCKQLFFQGF